MDGRRHTCLIYSTEEIEMYSEHDVRVVLIGSDNMNVMAREIKKTLAILSGLLKTFPVAEGLGGEVDLFSIEKTRYFFKTSRYVHPTHGPGADIYLYSQTERGDVTSFGDSLPLDVIEPFHDRLGLIMEKVAEIEPRIVRLLNLLKTSGIHKPKIYVIS